MTDTLLHGDYILVDKAVYRAQPPWRGDIVVFRYPPDERFGATALWWHGRKAGRR